MMRNVLVVLASIPMVAQAADLSVGTIEVSGDTSFGFQSGSTDIKQAGVTDTLDTTTIGLNVTGLYYVAPNIGVGLALDYSKQETKFQGATDGLSTTLIGPAVGIAFPVQEKLSLALQGMIGYATSTSTSTGSPDLDASGFGFGLGAGIKYFFVKSFSLDAGLAFNYAKLTFDLPVSPKPTSTTSGFGLNVGFSVYFGK